MTSFLFPVLIQLQDITTESNKGSTYPFIFSDCVCCGLGIAANFAKQRGNVVYCTKCLECVSECCEEYNK